MISIDTAKPNQKDENSPTNYNGDSVKGLILKSNLNLLSIPGKQGG